MISVERRADHAEHARQAIERFFGGLPANLDLRVGNVEDMVADVQPDRIVLDLPQPWDVVDAAVESLQGGGVFCAYVPTVPQMQQTVETLCASQAFVELMSFEAFLRTWNVDGRSVRPNHRMIGHTGFITIARKVSADGGQESSPSYQQPTSRPHEPCTRKGKPRNLKLTETCLLRLDEDALAGALLGRLDGDVVLAVGNDGETCRALGVTLRRGEDLGAFAYVGEAVVQHDEDIGGDLFAEAVTRAEVLIDPNLHGLNCSNGGADADCYRPGAYTQAHPTVDPDEGPGLVY